MGRYRQYPQASIKLNKCQVVCLKMVMDNLKDHIEKFGDNEEESLEMCMVEIGRAFECILWKEADNSWEAYR